MKRLILVRHGETEWNAARRLQGQQDIALSEHGRAQALALRPVIATHAPDIAFTSDLRRAAETSALLGHADAVATPRLREQGLGAWEGREIAELMAEDPDAYRGWRAGTNVPARAEGWSTFRSRVEAAMLDAISSCRDVALITCHGGVIRAALDTLIALAPSRIIPVGPGSMSILAHDGSGFRLEAFNFSPGRVELHAPD
ncbi:histidine phosphatase family protein [Paracoccus liaowanqingii]|uniref:Histidine phosphatase family protein n=1 Tax=Paracoccus liaowanqingii TaxID=2560053 RepID=A0A4Z1CRN0_9RHOB|nr:histidine phosphatase family protein [Paracoccus liaowanqingii]TGN67939.1 histidine phosphatase family protein [Paracoccus liaowanqingii]